MPTAPAQTAAQTHAGHRRFAAIAAALAATTAQINRVGRSETVTTPCARGPSTSRAASWATVAAASPLVAQRGAPQDGGAGSGGTSGGTLPVQRLWFLGGAYTVRGQPMAAAVGDAYWMTRLELGTNFPLARPTIFADLAWAGDRTKLTENVRPISGAGVGLSFLGGLVRFDLSKGIRPERSVRGNLYLDARF